MPKKNFDLITEYVIKNEEFKSWSNHPNFKLNGVYFDFTKPYKIQVEFWGDIK